MQRLKGSDLIYSQFPTPYSQLLKAAHLTKTFESFLIQQATVDC